MTKEEYQAKEQELAAHGYKKYTYGKYTKADDFEMAKTDQNGVIIIYRFWDFSKYGSPSPVYSRSCDIVLIASSVDNRNDLELTSCKKSIDEVEQIAEHFFKFLTENKL